LSQTRQQVEIGHRVGMDLEQPLGGGPVFSVFAGGMISSWVPVIAYKPRGLVYVHFLFGPH
jgi:hypothetical protein